MSITATERKSNLGPAGTTANNKSAYILLKNMLD